MYKIGIFSLWTLALYLSLLCNSFPYMISHNVYRSGSYLLFLFVETQGCLDILIVFSTEKCWQHGLEKDINSVNSPDCHHQRRQIHLTLCMGESFFLLCIFHILKKSFEHKLMNIFLCIFLHSYVMALSLSILHVNSRERDFPG